MKVAEIWRYPVKTMAGEDLQRATIGPLGIDGDRIVHVEDASGQVITSRSHPRFLGHKGSLLVIGGVAGLGEREWPGACLRISKVLIGVQDLRARCIMTSYDPDTLVQDKEITRGIYRRFEGKLALNCFVIEGGEIGVGDEVLLVRGRGCTSS